MSKFEVGSIVEGKVVKLKPFGAIVELDSSTQGLIHISQVANNFVQDIKDYLKEGDIVKIKIMSIDKQSGKISLSIREAQSKEQAQPRKNYNNQKKPHSDSNRNSNYRNSQPIDPIAAFEDKIKEWNKQSTERQAGINKRNNKR